MQKTIALQQNPKPKSATPRGRATKKQARGGLPRVATGTPDASRQLVGVAGAPANVELSP